MLRPLIAYFLLILVISCASKKDSFAGLLGKDALPVQSYRITNDRDTLLRTAKGALLRIERGSFSGDVTLLVREAYSMSDMVAGGLLTEASGAALSSGGMIELRAQENGIKIERPISVSIPTNLYDPSMQLYSGVEEEGRIDWKDPQPLPAVVQGKQLFQQNCATCHAVDKELTGPALRGFTARGPWADRRELYKFIHNPALYIQCNAYAKALQQKYGSIMQAFPQLTPEQIDAITDYIGSVDRQAAPLPDPSVLNCIDSCAAYKEAQMKLFELEQRQQALIRDNGSRVELEYHQEGGRGRDSGAGVLLMNDKVQAERFDARYYNVKIDAFGWHNIDRLVSMEGVEDRYLSVAIDQSVSAENNVFLAIPQYRIFTEGGRLQGKDDAYGFFKTDGTAPLPLGVRAIAFAISEKNGTILFGSVAFTVADHNELRLVMQEMDKAGFDRAMAALALDDVTTGVKDAKNAKEVRALDEQIRQEQSGAERLRPKSCDCGCPDVPAFDSLPAR
ncbi:cytochrome c [Flaviaesturariibacter amylovorans]|uniref:Cytochrome c domain-containing protein n=1 Tax=Flaviaesturariibacter amylovorans TaxID=1084520 RepID=A0ABP8GSS8_9BACT